jgi:hypothetical protein
MSKSKSIEDAANRVLALEHELESAGLASTKADELAAAHAALHRWVDSVVGVVASPGVGRVTLIHENGRQSKIASPDLPFLLSRAVTFEA